MSGADASWWSGVVFQKLFKRGVECGRAERDVPFPLSADGGLGNVDLRFRTLV